MSIDTDILIIGAGSAGIGIAVQLQKHYPSASFEILEINNRARRDLVPSHFYSFSFAINPNWSKKYAPQAEIAEYLVSLAEAVPAFDEVTGTWVVNVRDESSGAVYTRRSRILISAVGALSVSRECEIPGVGRYSGITFHSARWDHSFEWEGKDVVIVMHYVPLAIRLYRFYLCAMMEKDFLGFYQETGGSIREGLERTQIEYLKQTAPERYHEVLIPRTEIGLAHILLRSAQDYYGTCVSEFPNFFILMGPNTTTGHLFVLFPTGCEINFILRVLRPILSALYPSTLISLLTTPIQHLLPLLPDTQAGVGDGLHELFKLWARSVFVPMGDFRFGRSPVRLSRGGLSGQHNIEKHDGFRRLCTGLGVGVVAMAVGVMVHGLQIELERERRAA
ncbi:hypothetical protein N7532_006327 [Penicillium argentinense]|uniref:FAD/NAD(P)-binding domain-containing protein n=1 Tax=Penicillium argentinense TaxID=1131581 RepID=A0A9W9FFR5_9EURO|nr:uncharacterized protein N7532_006327 [Penicillium argentinense]KAJ5099326.1 hypothetical protein N7532_006327 [Penicillium argentinense]